MRACGVCKIRHKHGRHHGDVFRLYPRSRWRSLTNTQPPQTSCRMARRNAAADRGGSTSVRGRIRSPHSSGGLQGSCVARGLGAVCPAGSAYACCCAPRLAGVGWSRVQRPTRHNIGHFGGGLHSQSLDWYWQTKQYRKIQINKLNTNQKK